MKRNLLVFVVIVCLSFITHAFCGGFYVETTISFIGFFIILAFWVLMLAPCFKFEIEK